MSSAKRQKIYTAIVQDLFNASSTIKIVRLYVKEQGFSFKAGQWVDFYVPGILEATGYSMTSPPNQAKEKGILELSVKYGKFPPTHWLHHYCCVGQEVQIRVGGDFYYDPLNMRKDAECNLLLVGGGVGINPLISILYEYRDLLRNTNFLKENSIHPGKVHLLYSAKTEEELIFKDSLRKIEKEHPSLTCHYFVTKQKEPILSTGINYSRIQESDVMESVEKLEIKKTLCYICGPSNMTDDVAGWLLNLGVNEKNIKYEKWW